MVTRIGNVVSLFAVLLALVAPSWAADLSWNFENPPYTVGSVSGQDGWSVLNGDANVSAGNPLSGSQSLLVNGFGNMRHSTATQLFADGIKYQYLINVGQTEGHAMLIGGPAEVLDNFFWVKSSAQENVHRIFYYPGLYKDLGPCAANNTYQITGTFDFTSHLLRVTVKNLTDTSKPDLDSGLLAMNPTVTTANAGFSADFLAFEGETRYDNLSFVSPATSNESSCNFENPPYTVGSIGGQDGWSILAGDAYISTLNPLAGDQSLLMNGFGNVRHSTNEQLFADGIKYQYLINIGQSEGHATLVGGPAGGLDNFLWVKSSPQENVHRVFYYGNYADIGPCAPNSTYQITGVFDFTNHKYLVTVKNLTDTSQAGLSSGWLDINPTITTANAGYSADFMAFDGETRFDNAGFFEDLVVLPEIKYSDEVTVDGDLGDWADANWKPFDRVYDGSPSDIADGSMWAAKWGAGGTRVYTAVKVKDTAHSFKDAYTNWNARDAVELYLNTTGTDAGPYGANDYPQYQEQAQEWALGIKDSNRNAMWATCGYPPAYGDYPPSADELVGAGREDGEWLYYEAALMPFEYFGGRRGNPSIVSPLHENDVIRHDVTAVGHDGSGYTGMKSSGHAEGGWSTNYGRLAQHRLIRVGVKGTIALQDFGGSTLRAQAAIVITDASLASETHNIVLDGSGTYSFKTALRGTCTAAASATGYVSQSLPVVVDPDGNGSVNFTLTKQAAEAVSVSDAKKKALGSVVSLTGSITAAFSGSIYVEASDRVAGIRVDKAGHGFTVSDIGKVVNVTGSVEKDSTTQEIYINANQIGTTTETNVIQPLGLTNKAAGGGDLVDLSGNGQVGVVDGTGLNNIGLLVRTTGLASAGNASGFTLDDGSGVIVHVSLSGAGTTYDGRYVTVMGVMSIDSGGVRVIKARIAADVQPVN
ncbi:MAG: hypothetical protein ACYC64_10030 [Armatimonadota bacterium]